ncbi:MAG: signal peptidase II [Patescibacteria group bacterium]
MFKVDKNFILIGACALVFFVLDRFLKILALHDKILLVRNYNLALSIKLNIPEFVILCLYVFIFIILIFYLVNKAYNKNLLLFTACLFLIIGIASNFLDRLKFGFVIDYISFYFFYNNLSDIFIFLGIVLFLLQYKKEK